MFNASATSSGGTDALNVTINLACTMSGSGSNTYNVSVNPNQTTSDIGPTSIKTTCNDGSGYALYAVGYSGDSYYDNNTKLIGTNNSINTGTASTAGSNSYWAMRLSAVTGTFTPIIMNSFDSYHAVPSDFTMVAKYTASTDAGENAEGSTAQAYYEVKASGSQVADTYTGKVKYVLVHPNDAPAPVAPLLETDCPANKICYAPNNGNIDGSMDSISTTKIAKSGTAGVQNAGSNGTYTLIAPNYSLAGYGFAGWSPEFDATTATNPTIYGPNQTITTSTTAGAGDADVSQHGLILYPVWVASAGTMQSNASTVCSNLEAASYDSTSGLTATLSSISALTDERDDNTYAIAKLADGNCWMIENLRLNESVSAALISSGSQGIGSDFTALPTSENSNFSTSTTANNLYNTGNADTMPRYNSNNTNRSLTARYNGTGNTTYYQWYSYGNYYTWAAAMANTNSLDSYSASESAGTSLCPKKWQLPYGGSTGNGATYGGFSNLDTQMGGSGVYAYSSTAPTGADRSKMWRNFPNNFVYSGLFFGASAAGRSSGGYYWSSTALNSMNLRSLYLSSSDLYPGTYNGVKYNGYSIRCLASS